MDIIPKIEHLEEVAELQLTVRELQGVLREAEERVVLLEREEAFLKERTRGNMKACKQVIMGLEAQVRAHCTVGSAQGQGGWTGVRSPRDSLEPWPASEIPRMELSGAHGSLEEAGVEAAEEMDKDKATPATLISAPEAGPTTPREAPKQFRVGGSPRTPVTPAG